MHNLFSQLRNKTRLLENYQKIGDIRHWASVNVIIKINEEIGSSIAFIKRATNESDPWSGQYSLPGGRVEVGESYREAANRETLEEIGIQLLPEDYIGEFLRFQVGHKNKIHPFAISAHVSLFSSDDEFKLCPIEVESAFWLPINLLMSDSNLKRKSFSINSIDGVYPCIDFDGHTIWGITYYILRELFIQWNGIRLSQVDKPISNSLPEYNFSY